MNRDSIYTVPYSGIPDGSKILIYGFGKMGQSYYQNIKYLNKLDIVAVLDAKAYIFKDFWPDVFILEPYKIVELEYDYILIAVESEEMLCEIRNVLFQYDVDRQKIIWGGDSQDINCGVTNEVHKFLLRTLSSQKKRFFLFMLPEHGNTGDYAIGYAEHKFFNKYFSQYNVYGVTTTEWVRAKEFFINLINKDDVVFINGGGFLGDLRGEDVIYKDIVRNFPQNKKIFLPNNLTYKIEPTQGNEVFIKDIEWMKEQKNLYIFLRERKSFNLLNSYLENCFLAPDFVFLLNYQRINVIENGKILLCMRDDCEKIFKKDKRLEELLFQSGIDYEKFDIHIKAYISQDMGRKLLDNVVKKFQMYNCIITDRLHGMILSVISNVPCIAIDNRTHKIHGVYEWIQDMGYAVLMKETEIDNIGEIIKKVCDDKILAGDYYPKEKWFDSMAEKLQEILDM